MRSTTSNSNCPYCAKKAKKLKEMTLGVGGKPLKIRVCAKCASTIEALGGYVGETNRTNEKKAKNGKFDRFGLSPEEIAETQKLRPTVKVQDDPVKRSKDAIEPVITGRRETFHIYTDGSRAMREAQMARLRKKADAKFGMNAWRVASQNSGGEFVVESVN